MINRCLLDFHQKQDVIHITTKIVQVAIAALGFLTLQLHYPLFFSLKVTFAICSITIFCEAYIKRHDSWFEIGKINPETFTQLSFAHNLATIMKMLFLFDQFKSLGLIKSLQKILFSDPKSLLISCVIAPIFEEILFRGFLQERFEDLGMIITSSLNENVKKTAMITQAAVFGLLHNICYRNQDWISHLFLLFDTSYLACIAFLLKKENKGLCVPIVYHSFWNFIAHTRQVA